MYCSGCGSPIASGLSYCNRCGTNLKERSESKQTAAISAVVTAMSVIAIGTMGMLLGGPLALKRKGGFDEEFIMLFMFLTFFIGLFAEVFVYRQLSRLTGTKHEPQALPPPITMPVPVEFRSPQARALAEPVSSVTENTTRTLEYSREERGR